MASIFGLLDKRQRQADDAQFAQDLDFSYEERADLLADLLEDDTSLFPLLDCPPEVLSSVLLLSEAVTAVRMRPLCRQMRVAVDGNEGLWSLLTLRDFADLGGTTKHYVGLKTLAEWDESNATRRLEWDPLMICAPPPLRYSLLAAMQVRRQLWSKHGPSLGAGWDWFSAKVCRRMAVPTFLRWASLQHEPQYLQALLRPLGLSTEGVRKRRAAEVAGTANSAATGPHEAPEAKRSKANDTGTCGMRFRCGRSDQVELSEEAVVDIYETVQRWHTQEHREMMRQHFRGGDEKKKEGNLPRSNSGAFSVTPTLDAHEAAVFALNDYESELTPAGPAGPAKVPASTGASRGAASRHIEEAQLRLAMELSKKEAEEAASAPPVAVEEKAEPEEAPKEERREEVVAAEPEEPREPEFEGLPLRGEGGQAAAQVFVKPHCLAQRVEALPDALERSIESIVHKLVTPSSWALLYESVTEELCLRAKCAAHALCASHAKAMDQLDDLATGEAAKSQGADQISLDHERMCLPIWRKSFVMSGLSCLSPEGGVQNRAQHTAQLRLNGARHAFLRHAMLEWCELEDLTEFLDAQLGPLEMAIDNFRGSQDVTRAAHTPHVRDIGRLMFRNHCLLDSRVFRPLCLAAYALVHEIQRASLRSQEEELDGLIDLLEQFHGMLAACDVQDDHLSNSKNTKESFGDNLVSPISAAVETSEGIHLEICPVTEAQCPQLCWPQTPQSPVAPAAGPESYYGSAWGGYGYGNPYAAAPPYNPYGPYGSYHWNQYAAYGGYGYAPPPPPGAKLRRHHLEMSELKSEITRLQGELAAAEASRSQPPIEFTTSPSKVVEFDPNELELGSHPNEQGPSPLGRTAVELEAYADYQYKSPSNRRRPLGLKFMNSAESPHFSTAVMARILRHPLFDVVMCTIICINTIVFAMEAQYRGLTLEGVLGFKGVTPQENLWPGADEVFEILEWFFGVIYTLEVVFKLCVLGPKQFCLDLWNWMDTTIVLVWVISKVLGQSIPVNSQILRLFRIFRLFRLLRLVRRIQQFDHLFMMTTAIRGSVGILAWTSAVLFVVHLLLALLVQQSLFYFYFEDENITREDKMQIFEYFGTFTRALLTFFELTLANFAVPTRVMVEKVTEWCMVFCIMHKLTVGFAVIGVINGVLMQETFKVAQADDLVMLRTRQKAVATHVDKMRQFFEEADTSKDGRIDFQEFEAIMQNKEVKIWLSAMELDVRDVRQLFDLLDRTGDSDGTLSAEELVMGIAKLRGPARSIDINAVMFHQEKFEKELENMKNDLQRLFTSRSFGLGKQSPGRLQEMYKRGNSNTSSLQSSKPDPFSPAEAPIEEESDAKASPDDVGFRI
ncbi:Voltage-dependent T-type calcium channel subunit alpha-1I (Voltage-gated calcium channel subunit alpha Cav3.3) (Ca(v)3.3) [Durusdinium trenchii]|uniref:Voltage-dependent T-type calcium channel subunit alpha-1I (Voltage-gated calcium channel subunit alpha Cav3.3) (Ca(V)3.3) n=1 Tax=Durusdinium trenchii TaxID=1381693 RepID=A0ABP0L4A2_9DINO